MKEFLDLPPELLSVICNRYLRLTRDKMAFGLVCKRTREVVSWQEHYLDFDITQQEGKTDSLNGSPYPLHKWPSLVQVLLEKADLTISKISIKTSYFASDQHELNGAAVLHQIAEIFSQFQAKIQLKLIQVLPFLKGDDNTPNKAIRFAVDYMLYNIRPNCFEKIQIIDISNVSEFWHLLHALEGKALKVLKLGNLNLLDQNFDPVSLCNDLKPHSLQSLDLCQNWTVEQLQAFRNAVRAEIVSELRECSFAVDCSFTEMRDVLIPLVTAWFPKLRKCHLAVFGEEPNAQVTELCTNYYETMAQAPLFRPVVINLDEPQLPACQMEPLLDELRVTYPEMALVTGVDSCICHLSLGSHHVDSIGLNIGRYICENPQCQACNQDSSLLLREIHFVHDQATGAQVVHPGPGAPSPLHLFSLRICELEEMQGQLQMLQPTTKFTVVGSIAEDNMFVVLEFNWPDGSTSHGFFRIVACNVEHCRCKVVQPE